MPAARARRRNTETGDSEMFSIYLLIVAKSYPVLRESRGADQACSVSLTLELRLESFLEVLRLDTRLGALRPGQYSSGSKMQVDERSASVITQSLSPALVRQDQVIVATAPQPSS